MDHIWNEIKTIAEENGGFVRTSAVEAVGISTIEEILATEKKVSKNKGLRFSIFLQ